MTFFHFTSQFHIAEIIASEVIKTTESNVSGTAEHAGPDVVWLLDTSDALDAGHGLEGALFDKRECYVEVDVHAIPWLEWWWTDRMNPTWRQTMIDVGGGATAAARWYVWPNAIPASRWRSIKTNGQVITP